MPTRLSIALAFLPIAGCAADQSAPARPVRPLASYFTDNDYPATEHEQSGTSSFRLTVAANGRVSNCLITASSGSSALDAATCRLLTSRARFEPARDRKGRPTVGSISSRVQWRLPEDEEPAPAKPAS